MRADFGIAEATAAQRFRVLRFRHPVILGDRVGACGGRVPLLVQSIGYGLVGLLVSAVVTQKNDVVEAVQLEASRRVFEHLFEDGIGKGDLGRPEDFLP